MRPPGPRGLEKLRFLRRTRGPQILDAVFDLWQRYGDTAVVSLPFGRRLYFVNNPADVMQVLQRQARQFVKGKALDVFKLLIGEGVATADQDLWVEHRRAAQPMFAYRTLERYTPTLQVAIVEHRRRWLAADGGFLDFNRLLPRLAQDLVGRTLLGADLSPQLEPLQDAWGEAMDFVLRRTNAVVRPPLAWPLPSHRRFQRAARQIRDCVGSLIDLHRNGGGSADPDTFVNRMLRRDQDAPFDAERLTNQVLNILFAGHETTGNGLSSALFLILRHAAMRERILAELHEVVGDDPPVHADLRKLIYLRRVVYETLRLYPPVSLFVREALTTVPLSAGPVPAGAVVIVSPFVIHRQPTLWSDPTRFDPDRFVDPALTAPPHFFAFGAGGRTCLGDEFAINEMMLVLCDMLQNLELELDESTPIALAFNGTLRPDPLRIRLRQRRRQAPANADRIHLDQPATAATR